MSILCLFIYLDFYLFLLWTFHRFSACRSYILLVILNIFAFVRTLQRSTMNMIYGYICKRWFITRIMQLWRLRTRDSGDVVQWVWRLEKQGVGRSKPQLTLPPPFSSMRALGELEVAHPPWWWWSSSVSLLTQRLIRNTFIDTSRNIILPTIWASFSQLSWNIK